MARVLEATVTSARVARVGRAGLRTQWQFWCKYVVPSNGLCHRAYQSVITIHTYINNAYYGAFPQLLKALYKTKQNKKKKTKQNKTKQNKTKQKKKKKKHFKVVSCKCTLQCPSSPFFWQPTTTVYQKDSQRYAPPLFAILVDEIMSLILK